MTEGLPVEGFIAIVFVIFLINVGAVFGYSKFLEKNPGKAISVKLGSKLFSVLRWVMIALIAVSLIFSIACTAACSFVDTELSVDTPFGGEITGEGSFGFGCGYSGSDKRVDTAYAFAIINNLLTSAVLVGTALVQLNALKVVNVNFLKDATFTNKVWKIMSFFILASTWCSIFTFYIQQVSICVEDIEGFSCSLGGAGIAQVFNSILMIGICFLFFIVPSPAASENDDSGESDEEKGNKQDSVAPEESTTKNETENNEEEAIPAED